MPNKDSITGGSYVGNVVEIKISTFELVENKLKDINNHYEDLKTKLSNFINLSRGNAAEFISNSNVNKVAKYPNKNDARFHDSEGNLLQYVYERAKDVAYKNAYDSVVEEKKNYLQLLNDISTLGNKDIQDSYESLGEFFNSISKIRKAIENLEAVKCNFQERVDAFKKQYEGLGIGTINTNSVAAEEVKANYQSISLTDEFVTSEGTKSSFSSKYISEDFKLTKDLVEAKNAQTVSNTGSTVAGASNVSIFGKDGNVQLDENNIKEYTVGEFNLEDLGDKAYYAKVEATSDELVEYFPNLASSGNSKTGISMDKSLIEAIAGKKDISSEVNVIDAGEVKGETYTPGENIAATMLSNEEGSNIVDKMVEVDTVKVPNQITQNNTNYIDEQAKEIYYSKSPQLVSAERANALQAVDDAFNGTNDAEFRNILSQCYDDVDIDVIMKNKELAVTAFILATESKSLTDIANKLAKNQGIENYESSYDNRYDVASLENGASQSQLLAEVSDDVNNVRLEMQGIRSKYNDAVKRTNDSIVFANQKKAEMDEVKQRIVSVSGEDPNNWNSNDIELYNNAVSQYNEANRAANAAHNEAMSIKMELDQTGNKLNTTQEQVANSYLDSSVSEPVNSSGVPQAPEPVQHFNELEPTGNFVEAPKEGKQAISSELIDLLSNNNTNQEENKPATALDLSTITSNERTISSDALRAAVFGDNKANNS